MMSRRLPLTVFATSLVFSSIAEADNGKARPDSHAPIGVMGDHTHNTGEWMLSYRFMSMRMEDNIQGSRSVSPEEIVTTQVNPFPGPPNVRVVPVSMDVDMHMFGAMYAPTDRLTLMAMIPYLDKSMDHLTFQGMMGTNVLGTFTTESSGIGDIKLGALWRLFHGEQHNLHLNFSLSAPTGSIDETAEVLSPMNTRPTLRMPYPMQLGSGTYDAIPGITYTGYGDRWGWGSQLLTTIRLEDENDEGYRYGSQVKLQGWSSYRINDTLSVSGRIEYQKDGRMTGRDITIAAPVTTANPANYGGRRVNAHIGLNTIFNGGHRIALEYGAPLEEDRNGVQMEMTAMWSLGYQIAF